MIFLASSVSICRSLHSRCLSSVSCPSLYRSERYEMKQTRKKIFVLVGRQWSPQRTGPKSGAGREPNADLNSTQTNPLLHYLFAFISLTAVPKLFRSATIDRSPAGDGLVESSIVPYPRRPIRAFIGHATDTVTLIFRAPTWIKVKAPSRQIMSGRHVTVRWRRARRGGTLVHLHASLCRGAVSVVKYRQGQ